MNRKIILYIGAFILLVFALFHLAFWEMFDWSEELNKVSTATSGVLQILNIASIYMLLFFSGVTVYIGINNKNDLVSNLILLFISGYFIVRIVTGYFYFGWSISEFIIWLFCFVTALLFLYPVFKRGKSISVNPNNGSIQG